MRFLVLAPMPVELRPFVKANGLRKEERVGLTVSSGRVGGHEVVALLAGIGTGPAGDRTELAVAAFGPDHVVVTGIAGGLDPTMRVGDLHLPAAAVDAATGESFDAHPLGGRPLRGTIRTSGVLEAPEELLALVDGVLLSVDMETAAIARACVEAGVPWTAFRAISDRVGDGGVDDQVLALTNPDGSARVADGVRWVARHPHHVPRLVRLARGSALAAKRAAGAASDAIKSS